MYGAKILDTNFTSIYEIASLQNIINLLLFLLLTFVGSAVRVSIDVEINKKKVKGISFLNRWFIATVMAYVIEIFISEREFLRKYYSQIIIFFCIFVNDIIVIILSNSYKIFIYLLNSITKGIIDLRNTVNKTKDNDDNTGTNS